MTDHAAQDFERHRPRLYGIAYRMLGSRGEAEDAVQEAYLRWHHSPREEARSPDAWLVTTVSRLCIDRLRTLKNERIAYEGPWLPEPWVEPSVPGPEELGELASDLSMAFLVTLERLAPEERAAFLLHDVFDCDYAEIAATLGKTETACRQIVSRARKRVREEGRRPAVAAQAHRQVVDAYVRALLSRDLDGLKHLLADEISLTADGGGRATAVREVLRGTDRVAHFLLDVLEPVRGRLDLRVISVNGQAGLAVYVDGKLLVVSALHTDGERIRAIYSVLNPDKLAHVGASVVTAERRQTS